MLYYAHQSREKMLGASRARAETVSAEQQAELDRLQQSKAEIVEELNVLRRKLDAASADNAALKEQGALQARDGTPAMGVRSVWRRVGLHAAAHPGGDQRRWCGGRARLGFTLMATPGLPRGSG